MPGAYRAASVARRAGALAALLLGFIAGATPSLGAQSRPVVHLISIDGTIDMGLVPFVQRILEQARRDSAAAVILEVNTFGGRLDAAVAIRDALLATPLLTVAYINRRAISAGALISLAATRIAMADGGTIGAATPVQMGQPGTAPKAVEEKSISYVRKEFRSTADSRKRPPDIAEAMVDADVAIAGLVERGKLLTLTTDEALTHGVADFRAVDTDAVLAALSLQGAEVRRSSPNWGERVLRVLTSPIVASLLLSVAMLGILIELRTPGLGLPGALGVTSLALLLGGHWIVQLVGWEELLLTGIGMVLLAVEVFVIPGFGVAGIVGIAALLSGLAMGLAGHGATMMALGTAMGRIALSMIGALGVGVVIWRLLPQSALGRGLTLETELRAEDGFESAPVRDAAWMGRVGRATTPLRPAGIAEIDGERVDVVSAGELIEAGSTVIVSRVDGNRIVVQRHQVNT